MDREDDCQRVDVAVQYAAGRVLQHLLPAAGRQKLKAIRPNLDVQAAALQAAGLKELYETPHDDWVRLHGTFDDQKLIRSVSCFQLPTASFFHSAKCSICFDWAFV